MTPPKKTPRATPAPPKAPREVLPFVVPTPIPAPLVFRDDVPAGMQLRWSDARRVLLGMLSENVIQRSKSDATSTRKGATYDLVSIKFDERDVVLRLLIEQIGRVADPGAIIAEGEPDAFKGEG